MNQEIYLLIFYRYRNGKKKTQKYFNLHIFNKYNSSCFGTQIISFESSTRFSEAIVEVHFEICI